MKIEAKNAQAYVNHIKNLAQMTGKDLYEAGKIYSTLRRIETKANRIMCMQCNGDMTEEQGEKHDAAIKKAVIKLIGDVPGFFLNGDPRGYTLKIKAENRPANLYSDWGGYGILAPEF